MKNQKAIYLINVLFANKKINLIEKEPTLKEAQDIVEGFVESIELEDGVLLVNEEGRLHNLPYNKHASRILHIEYIDPFETIKILGNAIFIPKEARVNW